MVYPSNNQPRILIGTQLYPFASVSQYPTDRELLFAIIEKLDRIIKLLEEKKDAER